MSLVQLKAVIARGGNLIIMRVDADAISGDVMKKAEGDLLLSSWQKVEEARVMLEQLISIRGGHGKLETVVQALEESSYQITKQFRILVEFGKNARSNDDIFK